MLSLASVSQRRPLPFRRTLLIASTGLSAVAFAWLWLSRVQRRRRRSVSDADASDLLGQGNAAACEHLQEDPCALPSTSNPACVSTDVVAAPSAVDSPAADFSDVGSSKVPAAQEAELSAHSGAQDPGLGPGLASETPAGPQIIERVIATEQREAPTPEVTPEAEAAAPHAAAVEAPPGDRAAAGAGGAGPAFSVKNPEGLADMLIDCLAHIKDEAPGTPEALNYDMGGVLRNKLDSFQGKLNLNKIQKLFNSDSMQLKSASLDEFDVLVVSRVLRFHNKQVECLDLNSNRRIGPKGARHVAEHVLSCSYPLMSLMLSGCSLGNSGVIALLESLSSCGTLEILELCHNGISDGSVPFFCRALEENTSLQSLFLNNDQWCPPERQNRISDDGATQLARVIAAGREVKISLQRNAVSAGKQAELRGMSGGRWLRF